MASRSTSGCARPRDGVDARSDGDRDPGDMGLRARRGVDAARGALRQGRGRHRPDARRPRRRAAGPVPGRNAADRAADGRRARCASGARTRAVRRVERHADRDLTVDFEGGDVTAKVVIVAIPPAHRGGIEFSPELPAEYAQLAQHWPQGNLSKAYAAYETPFWRAERVLRRGAVRRRPGVHHVRRQPRRDGAGHPAGLHRRRAPSIRCRRRSAASSRWPGSPPCSARRRRNPSTTSTTVGAQRISRPAGRPRRCRPDRGPATGRGCASRSDAIFWAGTETADEWTGFLDGAVRSGRRAAAEVHRELAG